MRSLMYALVAVAALVSALPANAAQPLKPFQKIENCRWKPDRWNDGDSFHVITGDEQREIVLRLYFVDTPEAETAYRDRLTEYPTHVLRFHLPRVRRREPSSS